MSCELKGIRDVKFIKGTGMLTFYVYLIRIAINFNVMEVFACYGCKFVL